MAWSSGYREDQKGKLQELFERKVEALGVARAKNGQAVEKARRAFDRGDATCSRAITSFERHRNKWVIAEFKKLQNKTRNGGPELKPDWASREKGLMRQAERNVFNRHKNRLKRIEDITRRKIASLTRENTRNRSR